LDALRATNVGVASTVRARGRNRFADRLFSNDFPPLSWLASWAGAVDRIAPLRKFFMRHAVGTSGACRVFSKARRA